MFKNALLSATVRALIATVVIGGAVSTSSLAFAQGAGSVLVNGQTVTLSQVDTSAELAAELSKATTKAEVIALLNLASRAGLNKTQILAAIATAKANTNTSATLLATLTLFETRINANPVDGATILSFYDATGSTGATGAIGGQPGGAGTLGSGPAGGGTVSIYVG